jgi:hypothetical protein
MVDLAELLGGPSGVDMAPLFAYNANPAQGLKNLESSGDFEKVGTEPLLDGTEADHYRGTIDLEEVVASAPPDQREALRRSVDALAAQGEPLEAPVDAWLGEDGLIRRLETTASDGSGTTRVRIELFDFGIEVDADPPDAALVATLDDPA